MGSDQRTTEDAIMEATYRALCKHGYAGLTMQSIADEFDKTKAVLHYHYDTKAGLLVAFLDYLLERFNRNISVSDVDTPRERLELLVGSLCFGSSNAPGDAAADYWDLTTALLEVRAQAPHDDRIREQLTSNFTVIEGIVAAIIEDGIEQETFRSVDPERTATAILACANGARTYQVTTDRTDVAEQTHAWLRAILREWLYAHG